MSLIAMSQEKRFTPEEIAWAKAHGRIDEIKENRRLFPDAPEHKAKSHTAPAGAAKADPKSDQDHPS